MWKKSEDYIVARRLKWQQHVDAKARDCPEGAGMFDIYQGSQLTEMVFADDSSDYSGSDDDESEDSDDEEAATKNATASKTGDDDDDADDADEEGEEDTDKDDDADAEEEDDEDADEEDEEDPGKEVDEVADGGGAGGNASARRDDGVGVGGAGAPDTIDVSKDTPAKSLTTKIAQTLRRKQKTLTQMVDSRKRQHNEVSADDNGDSASGSAATPAETTVDETRTTKRARRTVLPHEPAKRAGRANGAKTAGGAESPRTTRSSSKTAGDAEPPKATPSASRVTRSGRK